MIHYRTIAILDSVARGVHDLTLSIDPSQPKVNLDRFPFGDQTQGTLRRVLVVLQLAPT